MSCRMIKSCILSIKLLVNQMFVLHVNICKYLGLSFHRIVRKILGHQNWSQITRATLAYLRGPYLENFQYKSLYAYVCLLYTTQLQQI